MPCPYCASVNQRGKNAVATIDVAEAAQDEARVYFEKVIVFYIR